MTGVSTRRRGNGTAKRWLAAGLAVFVMSAASVEAARVKDIATVEGVRENQLLGYGLVVGLNQTGDMVIGGQFTIQAMISMLNKMGINLILDPIQLLTRNLASVMVTAKLPPFAKAGMTLDASVSTMANAKSLQGGTLLLTPLKAPNQQVYAVAQGPISIGGFLGGGGGGGSNSGSSSVSKNHQTAGIVPNGAIVEKDLIVNLDSWDTVNLMLRQVDFTTSLRLADAVDSVLGPGTAVPVNAGQVRVAIPAAFQGRVVPYIAMLEALDVSVDVPAKVVINEKTGTVVLGEYVRLSTCAIAHGNLTITVKDTVSVSQPNGSMFGNSAGKTEVTKNQDTQVQEEPASLIEVDETVTLGEVVRALNAVGVTPRDLAAILSALKAAGALQANLEII